MFRLQKASLSYGGTPALEELDLNIGQGEQVCLIGPSGAGKTSLLALLNGRQMAVAGEVIVNGQKMSELSAKGLRQVRADIAWVPQDLGLVPNLSLIHI